MFKEFKEFAMRGNVIDMAIGIAVGAAFGTIARSLVDDIITPPLGFLLGNFDFTQFYILLKAGVETPPPYNTIDEARAAGAITLNYGRFIQTIISFLIIAFGVFWFVKGVNSLRRQEENVPPEAPTSKNCPYCQTTISIKAVRCPACTSELEAEV